jgi:L-rhamnose mutarotase
MTRLGTDLKTDTDERAADPKTREWRAIMKPVRTPLATRVPGAWRFEMEEVFHAE